MGVTATVPILPGRYRADQSWHRGVNDGDYPPRGVEVDARLYEVYTLQHGKIVRMDEFTVQSEALEAVGLKE